MCKEGYRRVSYVKYREKAVYLTYGQVMLDTAEARYLMRGKVMLDTSKAVYLGI